MAHGIVAGVDMGAVGFCKEFGGTWHGMKEYEQIEGNVSLEKAREKLGYEVVKLPFQHFVPEYLVGKLPAEMQGKMCDGLYTLHRADNGLMIHQSTVTNEYEIFQNTDFLSEIENGILASNPGMVIESCGSLFGGKKAFVNIIINRFQVAKDSSETINRLMYTNAFGGMAISACSHNTRVVCNNTERLAQAQGAANETLKKFNHTKGAAKRVEQHLVDLTKLRTIVAAHKEALDHLASIPMDSMDVTCFLGNIFPVEKDSAKKAVARRTNKQDAIQNIFETAPDLQGDIRHTRYAMYQAVTSYSCHDTITDSIDAAFVWDNIVSGGTRSELNRKAFDLLIEDNIPTPRHMMLA